MGERTGGVTAVVHSFSDQLAFSANLSDEGAWVEFYRRLWPTSIAWVRLDGHGQGQRDGLDRAIHLANGRVFYVDEKKRRKDYGDVLLEDWSVWYGHDDRRNKVGWALDDAKRCDFIAYAILPRAVCYLLPFELLRLAFKANQTRWEQTGRKPDVPNDGYVTRNIAVQWPVLRAAINEQMYRRFSSNGLELPTPTVLSSQLQFAWIE